MCKWAHTRCLLSTLPGFTLEDSLMLCFADKLYLLSSICAPHVIVFISNTLGDGDACYFGNEDPSNGTVSKEIAVLHFNLHYVNSFATFRLMQR